MQDPRALSNLNNLTSYRAWNQQAIQRTALTPLILLVVGLPLLISVITPFEHDARRFVVVAGAGLALYLAIGLGWMFFAVSRLNAWKRAHPWTPPAPRSW